MSAGAPASGLRAFASDNYAGVHPDVWAALADVDADHAPAYGADPHTERLQEAVREAFDAPDAVALPVFNGTGANVVALQSMLPPWGAVVAADTSHIHHDEGGAPERVGRTKLFTVPTPDGRLAPELVDREAHGWGFVHRAQPAVVEIAQVTELGTVYTPEQVRALADHAHGHGMGLYMDGARLFNAAAALELPLSAFTTHAGVDVVSLGGTKAGALGAEAVVVLRPEAVTLASLVPERDLPADAGPRERARLAVEYVRKSSMQLASKMRYVSAQLTALLEGDLGIRLAGHANAMARELAGRVAGIDGVEVARAPEANVVFAVLDPQAADRARVRHPFYDWDAARHEVRWMTSWDTTAADVDSFAAALGAALSPGRRG